MSTGSTVAAVAICVFLLGVAAVALKPDAAPIAVWWPAAGVAVAAVALSSGRRRFALLAAGQLLFVGVLASLLTATGGGPFAHGVQPPGPATAGSLVQLFLVGCALVVLVIAVTVAQRDVALAAERTVQARLRESVAFHDAVLAASPDTIYIREARTWATVWSSRDPAEALGYEPAEAADPQRCDGVLARVHPADLAALDRADRAPADLTDGEVSSVRFRVRDRAGRYRWLSHRITPFARDGAGQVTQLLGIARDITEAVEVEQRLATAAVQDPLTGLPNRRLLIDRLEVALNAAARTGAQVVVLVCDLDGFKNVNDTGGHAAGDRVLIATANRMRAVLRPADTVARIGGDEFVVLLQPAQQPQAQIGVVARRLIAAVAEPVEIDGNTHLVTASIGVAMPRPGDAPEDALRDADAAMYRAKVTGKDRFAVYDDTLRADVLAHRRIALALRSAMTGAPVAGGGSARLWVAYQTMIDLETQQVAGVEALPRLVDVDGAAVPPEVFVPLAEKNGLVAALGRAVLETACVDLAGWHARHPGSRTLGVSVNLSTRHAALADLVGDVRGALDRAGLAASLLTVELGEITLADADGPTLRALHELRELGVRIAIDDFGTGYTSVRRLAQLPITGVKIDSAVTAGLPDDPLCVTIVNTAVSLARELGLTCAAAGIETDAQLLALPSGLVGQGFLLSSPVSAAGIDEHLRAQPEFGGRAR